MARGGYFSFVVYNASFAVRITTIFCAIAPAGMIVWKMFRRLDAIFW
jgi:hypothetical protein